MSELSEMTTFWASVKGFVASAVNGMFREEEAVDVGPGSVTVRPYGEEGTQTLRTFAGAVVRPGDRVVVFRSPALKLVLGTPTVRGVASVLPLPFGDFGGENGVSSYVSRYDHYHTMPMRRGAWYGPSSHGYGVASFGTYSLLQHRQYAMPFYVPEPVAIDRLAVEITTGVSGVQVILSIYDDTGGMRPRTRRASIAVDASTSGVKTGTVSTTIGRGWYWIAIVPSHALTIKSAVGTTWIMGGHDNNPVGAIHAYSQDRGAMLAPVEFGGGSLTIQLGVNYPLLTARVAPS